MKIFKFYISFALRCFFSLSFFLVHSKIKDIRSRKQMWRQSDERKKSDQTDKQKRNIYKEVTVDKIFCVCLYACAQKWWSKTVVFMSINAIINYLITNLSFLRLLLKRNSLSVCVVFRNWTILEYFNGLSYAPIQYQFKLMQIHLLCVVQIDLPFLGLNISLLLLLFFSSSFSGLKTITETKIQIVK